MSDGRFEQSAEDYHWPPETDLELASYYGEVTLCYITDSEWGLEVGNNSSTPRKQSIGARQCINGNQLGNHVGAKQMSNRFCTWTSDPDGYYATSCGQAFELSNEAGLKDNGFIFCYHCGKRIKESK
jgi:hypothetical protein